jgi:hypothetical protein
MSAINVTVSSDLCVFQVFFNSLCNPGPEVALNRISYYRLSSRNKKKTEKTPFTIPFLPTLWIALIVQWRPSQLRVNSTPYSDPHIIKEGEEPRKDGRRRTLHSVAVVAGKAKVGDRPTNRWASINASERVGSGHQEKDG